MTEFKPFPELKIDSIHPDTGEIVVSRTSGAPVFVTREYGNEDEMQRLVDCWNACRKIHSPAAHIVATDEYVARLETLRKEAWARAEANHSPETATQVRSASTDAPETPGKQCTSVVSRDEAGQNLAGNWHTDLTNIPRDRRVLIAHPRDGKVYATTWVEPSKFTKGRWSGWTEGTEPVAWQHYPEHPQRGG